MIHGCLYGCYFKLSWLLSVNKYGVKCGTSLRVWENRGKINEILMTLMVGFSSVLDTGYVKNKMIKDKLMGGRKLWKVLEAN